jgi:hypothetical protein
MERQGAYKLIKVFSSINVGHSSSQYLRKEIKKLAFFVNNSTKRSRFSKIFQSNKYI